jgi:hypothetical protein
VRTSIGGGCSRQLVTSCCTGSTVTFPRCRATSWRRSQTHGVDPSVIGTSYHPDLDAESLLVRYARPVISQLAEQPADIPACIALTDEQARLLIRLDATPAIGRAADQSSLAEGFSYAENALGTNGSARSWISVNPCASGEPSTSSSSYTPTPAPVRRWATHSPDGSPVCWTSAAGRSTPRRCCTLWSARRPRASRASCCATGTRHSRPCSRPTPASTRAPGQGDMVDLGSESFGPQVTARIARVGPLPLVVLRDVDRRRDEDPARLVATLKECAARLAATAATVAEAARRGAAHDAIVEALRDTGGNRAAAATALGIACSTLYRKIAHYRITE